MQIESFFPPETTPYEEFFSRLGELEGERDDFLSTCLLELSNRAERVGIIISGDYNEVDDEDDFMEQCDNVYQETCDKLLQLYNEYQLLIEGEFSEENDKKFRELGPKCHKVITECATKVYCIVQDVIDEKIITTSPK